MIDSPFLMYDKYLLSGQNLLGLDSVVLSRMQCCLHIASCKFPLNKGSRFPLTSPKVTMNKTPESRRPSIGSTGIIIPVLCAFLLDYRRGALLTSPHSSHMGLSMIISS